MHLTLWWELLAGKNTFCLSVATDLARSAFYVVRANSAKFGLRAGNTKFNSRQNEE
jgi:hypothetical protein